MLTREPPASLLVGSQRPRIESVPPRLSSRGEDAADLAALAGLFLDPWQQYVLDGALGEREDGNWAARSVGLVVTRQNGKGSVLEARELAGLFLFGERLIIHSAHSYDTVTRAYKRILDLIESTPILKAELKSKSTAPNNLGLELRSGQELRFRTRTASGGRGFSAGTIILDEAMYLTNAQQAALMPVMSSFPNPQLWYVGSAVDQEAPKVDGRPFTRIRNRAIEHDAGLAYFEWSAAGTIDKHDPSDRRLWAEANPGLGLGTSHSQTEEGILEEFGAMGRREFAVERLGIGDWPTNTVADSTFDPVAWERQAEDNLDAVEAQPVGDLAFAVEWNSSRGTAAIGAAWKRQDGDRQVEVIDNREGIAWVPARLRELQNKHHPCAIVLDVGGPTAPLALQIEEAGVDLVKPKVDELIQACGSFHSGIEEGGVRHPDEPMLNDAAAEVQWRSIGDRRAFERRSGAADMAPFMACVLALFGVDKHGRDSEPFNIW